MTFVARVIRQFHDGAESVSLERTVALPFQPTMGTKALILTDEGGTPELEVIGLTMRAPDGPGVKSPALDVLLAFEPLTAAGRALELGWRTPSRARRVVPDHATSPVERRAAYVAWARALLGLRQSRAPRGSVCSSRRRAKRTRRRQAERDREVRELFTRVLARLRR